MCIEVLGRIRTSTRHRRLWALTTVVLMTCVSLWLFGETHPAVGAHPVLVTVDPGHGGIDPGAIGARGELEKQWNLAVAENLANGLRSRGVGVLLTRVNDRHLSRPYSVQQELLLRAALANRSGSALLISLHLNIESTGRAIGPIVYYQAGNVRSRRLAEALETALAAVSGILNPPRPSHLLILMASRVPSVVVELGFLSTPADRARLATPGYRAVLAKALANGILYYLGRS